MTTPKCPLKPFDKSDFDNLRVRLKENLQEIIPERDNREFILSLIWDIQNGAAVMANALLQSRWEDAVKERGIEVFGMDIKRMETGQILTVWHPELDTEAHTHRGVVFAEKIDQDNYMPKQDLPGGE